MSGHRHPVEIQRKAEVADPNSFGEAAEAWETWARAFASVEPLSGRELLQAGAVLYEATHRVRLWWLPGVTPDMRVRHAGRVLNIVHVIDQREEHVRLELLCKEEIAAARHVHPARAAVAPPAGAAAGPSLDFSVAGNSMYLGAI
jgi:SPP1 family predicted phage head-tail adaptor